MGGGGGVHGGGWVGSGGGKGVGGWVGEGGGGGAECSRSAASSRKPAYVLACMQCGKNKMPKQMKHSILAILICTAVLQIEAMGKRGGAPTLQFDAAAQAVKETGSARVPIRARAPHI
jgi:hypothetical protein